MYQAIKQIKSCYKDQERLDLSFNTCYLGNIANDVIVSNVTNIMFNCFYRADINLENFTYLTHLMV